MALDDSQATDWATVTTNGATSDPNSAWAAAIAGIGLGVWVDRTLNAQQAMSSSTGWGINPDGSTYRLGQPNYQTTAAPARNNSMLLLLLVGAVIMMSGKH